MSRRTKLGIAAGSMSASLLACTPIITIGYGEILILILVLGLIVGPVIFRYLRTRPHSDKENENRGDE